MAITEVAKLIESKQLSPLELTAELLERIDQLDGRLKSYATVMADHAIAAAKRAEEEITSGAYRGALHGIPIAVKDLCFTKGVPHHGWYEGFGRSRSRLRRHRGIQTRSGWFRFCSASSISQEGAMGGYNPGFDIPINPWNANLWSGASSSGSGVATAAGLCFGSLGSDTGGSIRFPAAACGTVGLKPTWGRVSRYGVLPLAESLDHVGPLTRTTADAGIVLQAISGIDPNDPTSLPAPVPDMLGLLGTDIKGVRIGLDVQYVTRDVDPELTRAVLAGVAVLEDLGAEIIEVQLPDMDPFVHAWLVLCSAEAVAAHEATYPSRRDDYGPWFRGWLDLGANVTGAQYARANALRAACTGHLRLVFEDIDILACPSVTGPPQPVTPAELYGPLPDARDPRYQRFTVPFDYNGAPTLSVPCGVNGEGLPLSLQFAGRHLAEPLLCQVGHAYEQATEWHAMHPPDEGGVEG